MNTCVECRRLAGCTQVTEAMVLGGPTCQKFTAAEDATIVARCRVIHDLGASSMLHLPQGNDSKMASEEDKRAELRPALRKLALHAKLVSPGGSAYMKTVDELAGILAPTYPWIPEKLENGTLTVQDIEAALNGAAPAAPSQAAPAASNAAAPAADSAKKKPGLRKPAAAPEPAKAAPEPTQPAPTAAAPAKRRPAAPAGTVANAPAKAAAPAGPDLSALGAALDDLRARADFLGKANDEKDDKLKGVDADFEALDARISTLEDAVAWLYRQHTGDASVTAAELDQVDWTDGAEAG